MIIPETAQMCKPRERAEHSHSGVNIVRPSPSHFNMKNNLCYSNSLGGYP